MVDFKLALKAFDVHFEGLAVLKVWQGGTEFCFPTCLFLGVEYNLVIVLVVLNLNSKTFISSIIKQRSQAIDKI